jgi:hypothetical protein
MTRMELETKYLTKQVVQLLRGRLHLQLLIAPFLVILRPRRLAITHRSFFCRQLFLL